MKILINIISNLFKKKYFFQMVHKVYLKLFDKKPKLNNKTNLEKFII